MSKAEIVFMIVAPIVWYAPIIWFMWFTRKNPVSSHSNPRLINEGGGHE